MDYWDKSFRYPVTPKRGPMPRMSSLIDARGALLELRVGQPLLVASHTGRQINIQWAFDTLVAAVDEEGWFEHHGGNITMSRTGS